jgi:3-methyl-2-oxobutanoate hydroxymethyltransferase
MSLQSAGSRTTLIHFSQAKQAGQPLALLTAYDYTTAQRLDDTPVDGLLVGDSLAMTVLGHPDTLQLTVQAMMPFVRAVVSGAPSKWVIADMPFMSYQADHTQAIANAGLLIKQGGAQSVKVEGASPRVLAVVQHLTEIGIPVMGHLGLTPQAVNTLGGFKVQAKQPDQAERLLQDAMALQAAGCYSLVLECIPPDVAQTVTQALTIPTIGIGAGPGCDGQILVIDDMLGRTASNPKFVRVFAPLGQGLSQAATAYCQAVKDRSFPDLTTESYKPLQRVKEPTTNPIG